MKLFLLSLAILCRIKWEKQNKTKQIITAFATVGASSSKTLNGQKVRSFADEFALCFSHF